MYAFGGRSSEEFRSSIERYNIDLNIWNLLSVKLPNRVSNLFAGQMLENEILLCGGLLPGVGGGPRQELEVETRVLSFNTEKREIATLRPLPFKKKLSHVVFNTNGKLFCLVVEKNKELPKLFVYNVRSEYPQFDAFEREQEKERKVLSKY